MRPDRRLVLKREQLTELRANELTEVAGGQIGTLPVGACVVDLASRHVACDSLLRPCISYTCTL
jgi:hypothetical protein